MEAPGGFVGKPPNPRPIADIFPLFWYGGIETIGSSSSDSKLAMLRSRDSMSFCGIDCARGVLDIALMMSLLPQGEATG